MEFGSVIIGVCRFSFLGIGDWRAMHSGRKGRTMDQVIEDNRKILFEPERLERRFRTFENLTLASLAAQRDKDFVLLTLTSDELPEPYKQRLEALAVKHPFMKVLYRPPGRASKIFTEVYGEMGHQLGDVLQFRLDDDDAVSRDYIADIRKFGAGLAQTDGGRSFTISHSAVLYVVRVGSALVICKKTSLNNSAGQAMRHRHRNVLEWAHHLVDRSVMTLVDPHRWVLQTALSGVNDTGQISEDILRRMNATEIEPESLQRVIKRHFPFASTEPAFWEQFMQ